MTSIPGRSCPCQERPSVAPLDSSLFLESKFSKQPAKLLGPKSPAAPTDVPKYSEDNLQRIFKIVQEAWALFSALVLASVPGLALTLALATFENP